MTPDEPGRARERPMWNGEPCKALRGSGVVEDSPAFPLFWARDLVGQRIPVVRVWYGEQHFTLDDRDGYGWAKLTIGHGSPRYSHRNLTVSDFEPTP